MLRKIFYIGITSFLLIGLLASFVVFAEENAQKKEEATDIWEEFKIAEEAPAPPPVEKAAATPSTTVRLAIGFGIAGLLGLVLAIIAMALVERLRRRVSRLEQPQPEAEEAPDEPEPAENAGAGGDPIQNILMIFGIGILGLSLAFGSVAYAQSTTPAPAATTVTIKDAVKINQQRILALKNEMDSLQDKIQKLADKLNNLTPAPTTPTPTPKKKGGKPTTVPGLTEAKVRSLVRSEIRKRAVELPKIAKKNGWAAKREREIAALKQEIARLRAELVKTQKSLEAEAKARVQGDAAITTKIPPPFNAQEFGRTLAEFLKNNGFLTQNDLAAKADQAAVESLGDRVSDLETGLSAKADAAEVDAIQTSVQGAEENLGKLAEALTLLAKTRGEAKAKNAPLASLIGHSIFGIDQKVVPSPEAKEAAQKAAAMAEEIAAKYATLK